MTKRVCCLLLTRGDVKIFVEAYDTGNDRHGGYGDSFTGDKTIYLKLQRGLAVIM